MKNTIALLMVFVAVAANAQFDTYFLDKTMRMDYYHSGNHETEFYSFDELIEETIVHKANFPACKLRKSI